MGLPVMVFAPILKEKVWGGRRLARYGKRLPDGAQVGESWELVDLGSTSADGGGGDAARSVVAGGPFGGARLDELVRDHGAALLGPTRVSAEGGFPLLVKFLDAREDLSVQVHPSGAYAAAHAGAHLKTESWYVVEAEPGAKVYAGVREGVDAEAFAAHIASGEVVDDLIAIEARAGDVYHLPSGTCHALGAGVLVAEVQTPSDTTFRVYDWGRTGRALHVEQAMECIAFGRAGHVGAVRGDGSACSALVESPFYSLRERRLGAGEHEVAVGGRARVWMWLEGAGRVSCDGDGFGEVVDVRAGTSALLPACAGVARVEAECDVVVLEAEVGGR